MIDLITLWFSSLAITAIGGIGILVAYMILEFLFRGTVLRIKSKFQIRKIMNAYSNMIVRGISLEYDYKRERDHGSCFFNYTFSLTDGEEANGQLGPNIRIVIDEDKDGEWDLVFLEYWNGNNRITINELTNKYCSIPQKIKDMLIPECKEACIMGKLGE
jgi:hypothetical protein